MKQSFFVKLYAKYEGTYININKKSTEMIDIEQYGVNNVPEELLHRLTEQYLIK